MRRIKERTQDRIKSTAPLNINNDFLHISDATCEVMANLYSHEIGGAHNFEEKIKSLERKLDDTNTSIKSSGSTLLLSLYYAKRLRRENPDFFKTLTSPSQLFVFVMLLAFKYLNDEGSQHYADSLDELWTAASDEANPEDEDANNNTTKNVEDDEELAAESQQITETMELDMLDALQWRLFADPLDFSQFTTKFHRRAVYSRIRRRHCADYSDSAWLLSDRKTYHVIKSQLWYFSKAVAGCVAIYCATVIVGSVAIQLTFPRSKLSLSSAPCRTENLPDTIGSLHWLPREPKPSFDLINEHFCFVFHFPSLVLNQQTQVLDHLPTYTYHSAVPNTSKYAVSIPSPNSAKIPTSLELTLAQPWHMKEGTGASQPYWQPYFVM